MKTKLRIRYIILTPILCLLCGCATKVVDSPGVNVSIDEADTTNTARMFLVKDRPGKGHVFTNACITMWIPADAQRVRDGMPTSFVEIDEVTPPKAFVKDHKIFVEVQISTEREFELFSRSPSDWYFQEHPVLSSKDVPAGTQLRKDIRDPQRRRVLFINALVHQSATSKEDVETAKKMIESIELIPEALPNR